MVADVELKHYVKRLVLRVLPFEKLSSILAASGPQFKIKLCFLNCDDIYYFLIHFLILFDRDVNVDCSEFRQV